MTSFRSGGFTQREWPDFEDTAASLLPKAMVVDAHPRPGKKDRTRARESEPLREPESAGLDVPPYATFFAAVRSGLPTDRNHTYCAYFEQFTCNVLNHGDTADAYRAERPACDLGFAAPTPSRRRAGVEDAVTQPT